MQRILTSAILVAASAVLLSGCAASGPDCAAINDQVRDISNGAQNTLSSTETPAEIGDFLDSLSDQVGDLENQAGDGAVKTALEKLDDALGKASDFAATLPTDPDATRDADGIAAQQTAIADAADAAKSACTTS